MTVVDPSGVERGFEPGENGWSDAMNENLRLLSLRALNQHRIATDVVGDSHTGDTAESVVAALGDLPEDFLVSAGRVVRVRVYGTKTGQNGAATLRVGIGAGRIAIFTVSNGPGGEGAFMFDVSIHRTAAATQSIRGMRITAATTLAIVGTTAALTVTGVLALAVLVQLASAADTVTISHADAWIEG